jgi:hypothetical protein
MKSSENKGITATIALKNEVAGKASMPEFIFLSFYAAKLIIFAKYYSSSSSEKMSF